MTPEGPALNFFTVDGSTHAFFGANIKGQMALAIKHRDPDQGSIGMWHTEGSGPRLVVSDGTGVARLAMGGKPGPFIEMIDSAGSVRTRLDMNASDSDAPRAQMFGDNGKPRVYIGAESDLAIVQCYDLTGQPRSVLSVSKAEDQIGVFVFGTGLDPKIRAGLFTRKGVSVVGAFGADGRARATLTYDRNAGDVARFDDEGKRVR